MTDMTEGGPEPHSYDRPALLGLGHRACCCPISGFYLPPSQVPVRWASGRGAALASAPTAGRERWVMRAGC